MAKIYIVCPVRKLTEPEKLIILDYVNQLEKDGHEVRCPFRDTDQIDEIGLRIVDDHEKDIIWADEVRIWWNPTSEGSLWDFAQYRMAKRFMPEKRVLVINVESVDITENKTYTNVLLATHFQLTPPNTLVDLKKAKAGQKKTLTLEEFKLACISDKELTDERADVLMRMVVLESEEEVVEFCAILHKYKPALEKKFAAELKKRKAE